MKTEPPKPKHRYSNKSEQAIAASAHRDGNLSEWEPENMKKSVSNMMPRNYLLGQQTSPNSPLDSV